MAYVTTADFIARFGQAELDQLVPHWNHGGGDPHPNHDGRTFAAAEADASAIVDSYLASRPGRTYTLPLAVVPPRLVEIAVDLLRFELYSHAAPEEVKRRRDAAIAFLEKIANGELSMAGLLDTTAVPVGIAYSARDRVFTDETLAGY